MGAKFSHDKFLLWAIILGVALGIAAGAVFGSKMQSITWLGVLFLNALKMTIIPLIVAAVISGVASLGDIRKLGTIGGSTVGYYASTTAVAVIIGLVVVNLIRPGDGIASNINTDAASEILGKDPITFSDIILTMVSPNLIAAASQMQLLPIIVFSLIFGAALTTVGESGRPVINFFNGINDVMMTLVNWIMYFAPVGIFALIASRLGETGGGQALLEEISGIGAYVLTVILGLACHFIFLVCLLKTFTGRGLDYITAMSRAIITAFGTASSSATLPITMSCAQEAGISARSTKFVLPLGATVNMDGTALYEAVAVMFIAQVYAIEMGFYEQTIIFVTATLAAIGAAGIPQAGLVTMIIVLSAVNLPLEGISLLLAVDWLLDRFRTAVNVSGDSVGAAIIDKFDSAVFNNSDLPNREKPLS
jgi:Na+/H+-dicarboxylate symporter